MLLNLCDVEIANRNCFLYDVSYPSLDKEVVRKVVQDQTMVDIYMARLNFLGLPRSGKSTTMKRLMGEIVDMVSAGLTKELESTGVAERNQAFICRGVSKHFTIGWFKSDLSREIVVLKKIMEKAVKGMFS